MTRDEIFRDHIRQQNEVAEKCREKREPMKYLSTPLKLPLKTGRNEPCPCGSGMKYKKCCGK
jgi:preprotein translocase subunit SecA